MRTLTSAASLALLNLAFVMAVGALVAAPFGPGAAALGVAAAATSAVVAGLLVAVLARVPFEVTSPASSVAVIYAAMAAELVARPGATLASIWVLLSAAVVCAGVLMLLAARWRFAEAVRFLPAPVSAGFVSGIGLLVVLSQLGPLTATPGALAVGLATALFMHLHARRQWPGPANVAALAAGTALHHALAAADPAWVGPTLGSVALLQVQAQTVATVAGEWRGPALAAGLATVLPYGAFLALQATMNAAVSGPAAAAVAGATPEPHRTLRAQGIASIACGLLGAMPVCTHTVITMAAARQRTRWQDVAASCGLLLAVLLVVGGALRWLPVAALAGTLVMSGIGLLDKWARRLAVTAVRTRGRDREVLMNLGLVAAVAASFVVGSVPLALLVGSVLAMVLLAVSVSAGTRVTVQDASALASTRVWAPAQAAWLAGERRRTALVRPRGGLFFGTAEQLSRAMAGIAPAQRHCIVDMTKLATLDATGCQLLAAGARRLAAQGTATLLAGLDAASAEGRALVALGLDAPPPGNWLPDVDHAIERAEAELLDGAGIEPGTADSFAASPLTRELQAGELRQLQVQLVRREAPAGALFVQGELASSMFLVHTGRVEIRIDNAETGRSTRLASFGPGSIFGEVSLLATGVRSAQAWCAEPCVLFELTREAFDALAAGAPRLHAQVLRNLGVHLANRLVIATSTVQAQQ